MDLERMSKSGSNDKNSEEITLEIKLESLKSQVNYWKLRYQLLKTYGVNFNGR